MTRIALSIVAVVSLALTSWGAYQAPLLLLPLAVFVGLCGAVFAIVRAEPPSATPSVELAHMPRRLESSEILALTVAAAIAAALLRWTQAPVLAAGTLLALVAATAVAQIAFPAYPRWASTLAGFIVLVALTAWRFLHDGDFGQVVIGGVLGVVVGYFVGGCLAGVFLITDGLRALRQRRRLR